MNKTKVGSFGTTPIYFDDFEACFTAEYNGSEFTDITYMGLRETLSRQEKQTRRANPISVPAVIIMLGNYGESKPTLGEFTGKHAGNGNYLFKGQGVKGVHQAWTSTRALKPEFFDEWVRLHQASKDAQAALAKFEQTKQFDWREEVDKALSK